MADFDMTGWEEISPEEVGVYINDKNDSINASNFDDATDVRYKYNTGIEREDNWKFIGKTKITGELAELQRNIFSSAGRGVFNGIVGMARGVASEAVSTGQLIESGVSDIALRAAGANQQYRKQYSERLNEAYGALDGKLRKWIDTLTLSQDQKDQEVAYNLGAAVGNVIGTIGAAFATKNPKLVFGVMGVSASGDIKSELRDKGANIYKSSLIGTSLGAFMGASEKIGAEPILNALGKKIVVDQLFKKKALKVLAKSGVSEGLEEFTQNTVEDAVMKALGYRDKTVTQIMKDGLEGAAYGAFGGLFGGGVFMPAMIQAKKDTKQKLVDAGLEESKADELADSIVYDQKEVEDAVSELMEKEADQETLTNGSYEEDTKRFSDALKQDFLAEEFEIQETAKQKMIEAGQSEEDAQGYAVMISNFARNISRITGQTPREVWEEKGLNLINENYPQPNDVEISESELTPEEKAKADELDVPFQTDILRPGDEGYEEQQEKNYTLKPKDLEAIRRGYKLGATRQENIDMFKDELSKVQGKIKQYYEENEELNKFEKEQREKLEAIRSRLPKQMTAKYLKNLFKQKKIKIVKDYVANTGSEYITIDVDDDYFVIRFADHYNRSSDYVEPNVEFIGKNDWYSNFVWLADKLNIDNKLVRDIEQYFKIENERFKGSTSDITQDEYYDLSHKEEYIQMQLKRNEQIVQSEKQKAQAQELYQTDEVRPSDKEYLDIAKQNEELDKTNPAYEGETININGTDRTVYNSAGERIAKSEAALRNFYNWFGDSKAVDKDGKPLVVYHGSPNKFDTFDKSKIGTRDYGYYGKGFYFSPNEEYSKFFYTDNYDGADYDNGYIYPVYLKMEKPLFTQTKSEGQIDEEELRNKGYDGVIVYEPETYSYSERMNYDDVKEEIEEISQYANENYKIYDYDNELIGRKIIEEVVVFEPNQIKSTENRGTYSTTNDNIFYQMDNYDDLQSTKRVSDLKKMLKGLKPNEEIRIMYDRKKRYWFAIDANNYIHRDMITKAYEQGLYPEFSSAYDAEAYFDENYNEEEEYLIRFKTIGFSNKQEQEDILKDNIGVDDFVTAYIIKENDEKGYILFARSLWDIKDTPLKSMGKEAEIYDKDYDTGKIEKVSEEDLASQGIYYQTQDNAPKQIKRGSYTPTKNLITLFKTSNRSTIIHELGHYFTINYVNVLEERGLQDELKGFYDWLGIKNINEATTETWERMARGFETYAMEGVAPNVSTQSLFARMKQWLVDVYSDIKGNLIAPEEINDDVREFFDKMLTSEQEVFDLSSLTGKTQEINDIIKNILQGQEVDFQGFSVKDLEHLVKAVNMRLPKLPKNLEQAIRKAGGIDIEFAKAIGIYDEKKGNMHGFFKKNGAIKKEDALIEFLKDKAYLVLEDAKTYGETAEIMDRVTYLLEDAANAYSENDLEYINDRNAISEVIDEASRILQDINYEDITKALKVIKENDAVIVNKNTLEYMKARVKRIEKDHKKVVKEIRKKQKDLDLMRSDVSTYIKEQPISADHKLRLLNKVKNIKDEESFINVVNEVKDRAKDFYLQEQKKLLSTQIHKEIKKSRPKRVTQQKYDYERNVLFKDLRDYDKLTKEKAGEAIINLLAKEDKTETDLIRMRFLNYKANGMSSSTQLMEKVLDDIRSMKQLGSQIKDQADLEAKINREELKQNVMEAIANNKADKNTTKTAIGNLYRKGFTNLYSMINSITSKALADKFEMATVLNDAEVDYFVHTKKVTERMIKLFGLKSKGDLLNKFAELGERVGTLTTINESGNSYEISKMDVIDIYNSMKNEKKRADYIQAYGEPQIMRFVNMLNDKERLMADEMMEDVNSFFPETNKVYVETYGMDLKKVENYWPATSEHSETTDLLADFYAQQETPSFYKERAGGRVVPVPKNAWAKYLKHINESIYMIKIARKYKTIRDTFKSSRVRNRIENKYGKDIYAELMKQIEAISLNARSADLNFVEQVWGKFFNNFVVAKIAVAPTVLAGQFTAITNYAENVDTAEFYKQFTKGLANPKETIEFMQKYEKDFMETRFAGGYSEAVSRVLADAGKANNQRFKIISDKTKFDSINALTYFVRIGDLGSVMFGGYAQIQADLKAGVPLEKALHRFEEQTITSQQSSNKAALSSLQQTTGLGRILLAFKNTAHQYLRKVADSIIQYQRGEITANQCAKVVLNYAVVQPTLYILAKNAVKAALGLDDDDDSIFDGLPETLLLGIFDAVPIVSDILHTTYKGLTGGYISHILSTPGLDDIENSIRVLFKKKDKGVFDWVEVVAPLIEGTTSIPVARYGTMFEKWEED